MLGAAKKKFDRRRKLSKRRAFQISASVVVTTTVVATQRQPGSRCHGGGSEAYQAGCSGRHGGGKGTVPVPVGAGFFPAQFAPFLHKNPELLVDGFDNFLGKPLVHSCLRGTNNSKNLLSNLFHFPVDFYNICSNLHSNCLMFLHFYIWLLHILLQKQRRSEQFSKQKNCYFWKFLVIIGTLK